MKVFYSAASLIINLHIIDAFQLPQIAHHPKSFHNDDFVSLSRIPNTSTSRTKQSTHTTLTNTNAISRTALSMTPPQISNLVSSVGPSLGSITVLAFVILIHEMGHFLAATTLGINVQEFSVGVGPKLLGFTYPFVDKDNKEKKSNNDQDEQEKEGIEFNLRAIPLGGYVRFPENYNATLVYEQEVEVENKRRKVIKIINQRRKDETKKSSAGLLATTSFFNDLFNTSDREEEVKALTLELIQNEKLQQKEKKSNFSLWNNLFFNRNNDVKNKLTEESKEEGDADTNSNTSLLYSENGVIVEEDGTIAAPPIKYNDDPNLLQNRSWKQRAVVLVGGVVFNILLAFSLYFGELTVGTGLPKPIFGQGALITASPKLSGPSVGLLEKGDVILALNGEPLSSITSPTAYTAQQSISKFISNIRTTTPGDSLHLSVLQSSTNTVNEIDVTPQPMTDPTGSPTGPLSIGVLLSPNFIGKEYIKAMSVGDAFMKAGGAVSELTTDTTRNLLTFFGALLSGRGLASGQSVSGPIGVIKAGSDIVSTNDISAVVAFAAAISVNLAVVNSLPLPALDGGQLMFVLFEGLTKKKIDQRTQENINSIALLFLLLVSCSTVVGDLTR